VTSCSTLLKPHFWVPPCFGLGVAEAGLSFNACHHLLRLQLVACDRLARLESCVAALEGVVRQANNMPIPLHMRADRDYMPRPPCFYSSIPPPTSRRSAITARHCDSSLPFSTACIGSWLRGLQLGVRASFAVPLRPSAELSSIHAYRGHLLDH
jgi:hypothetical protein